MPRCSIVKLRAPLNSGLAPPNNKLRDASAAVIAATRMN